GLGQPGSQTEEIRPVGDDGHGVAARGQLEGAERILADDTARLGHARGVHQGQYRAVATRYFTGNPDQSAVAAPIVERLVLLLNEIHVTCPTSLRGVSPGQ